MIKKILFFTFFISSFLLKAQVSLNVSAIEVDEPVTITVDINSTDSNCNGLSNPSKVYMHSGIGDKTNAFGFSVVGNWGQDDGVGEMTPNGDGTYSITITPQTYYGLTQEQADNAAQIGMVFRNADGSQELKASGCNDFIFPVGKVQISIKNPTKNQVLISSGDNLTVSAEISFQGSVTVQGTFEIFYNSVSVATGTCGFPACNATITNITESGTVRFVGTAPSSTESGEASFEVIVAPTVVEEAIPSGLLDGINYSSDATKATLVVTAPNKDFVQVAGSFNNYTPTAVDVMKRDPSTGKYWLEINGLTSGKIETYQYWVFDKTPIANSPSIVKTADPYSTLVLSPFDDPGISSNSYPNIPSYPSGQEREVTVLQTGQTPYNWQVTNFNAPKEEDLIIYEVLVRDFDANRNYQDLIDRIDYFKNLNINAIQLMPVMEYEGNESWGYNTSFHMALDKFYGTEAKFKEFIDVCHQNGIAVILDVALNHAFGRNPLVRMWMNDPDNDGWGDPSSENPYFNETARHSYNVGSDFNHQSALTQEYTKRVVKHWIENFNIDGFRWDLTKGFTQNCSGSDETCTNAYQQDRVDVLKSYADYSWSLDPEHYVIFEHLGGQNEEKEWANYRLAEGKGIMMWGKMTDPYSQLLMGYSSNSNISGIGHKSRSQFNGPRLIGYPESHDEERIMYRAVNFGNSAVSSHNVKDLNTALSRMSAIGAFSITIPGPKMLWHFADLGMQNSIFTCNNGIVNEPGGTDGDCKLDTKPQPQWSENWISNVNRKKIYDDWARMNVLKINEPVFEGDYTITSGSLTPRIDIFNTTIPTTQLRNVIVLANFDVVQKTVNTNFPLTGNWIDLMDETNNTTYSASTITLQPGEFKVFGNQQATLSTENNVLENNIMSLYPNPTSKNFSISQNVSEVSVFDITGKRVKKFTENSIKNNLFSTTDLNTGIYFVRIKNDKNSIHTKKLIIN
ncbi:T9SS type A sorting domain-containing protein [Polaribacter aestuariivivens]|uniref:T9SS type A sorting domain-containing protein n=1 Tax=Polaribacter aestuariivivens TaxID=2304626 RepID=A0A5S3N8S5_9FLAO|nr:alpha-amylase family glycosyl hydrolase [Polaribacter aestuariivivens]TMM31522.1 T9SS type A sorting domain-containing protein [Polaribacter aestuariivivens]